MAIYNGEVVLTPQTAEQKAEKAAEKIFKISNRMLNGLDEALKKIREAVAAGGGKPAIVAEIGGADATELQNFYNAAKALVEAYSPIVPDDL